MIQFQECLSLWAMKDSFRALSLLEAISFVLE